MYTGFDPRLKQAERKVFVALGGETSLPFKAAHESMIFKNGSLLLYGVNYTINSGVITLLTTASTGDKYQLFNFSRFNPSSSEYGSSKLVVTGTQGVGNTLVAELFNAEASGFQWYRNGAAITGATDLKSNNLLFNTEDFTQWAVSACTVTPNYTTAPDGTVTADRIVMGVGGWIDQDYFFDSVSIGDQFTWSCYVNSSTPILGFGSSSIAGGFTSTVLDVGGGWYRQYLVKTSTENATNKAIQCIIRGPQDLSVWGAQLVKGGDPLPYMKVGATATIGHRSYYTQTAQDLGSVITVKASGVSLVSRFK